jgi:inner membrane protein
MKFPLLAKALAIGAIVFLLTLVLMRIDWLVSERKHYQREAISGVESSMAGEQVLLGPLLARHCTELWEVVVKDGDTTMTKTESRLDQLVQVPSQLSGKGGSAAQVLRRGLFNVNTYGANVAFDAMWTTLAALAPPQVHKGSRVQCGPIHAVLAVRDARGIRQIAVQINGERAEVRGGTLNSRWGQGLHVLLPEGATASADAPLRLQAQLELAGTQRLSFVPAAEQAAFDLQSDWPHPSFGGRFLPVSREVSAQGFSARWAATSVSSSAARDVAGGATVCTADQRANSDACLDTFEVAFFDPVNPYTLTDRATKYALLFIVLTFAAVAMTEVLGNQRVHPIQYTLVGLALATFYLLLLSLSEHIAFMAAYGIASAACVLLLGHYAGHMFKQTSAGLLFGAAMAGLYGLLWVLLQAEQTALAIGSVLLFAVLAAVMVATRKLDWYRVFASKAGADPAASIKV